MGSKNKTSKKKEPNFNHLMRKLSYATLMSFMYMLSQEDEATIENLFLIYTELYEEEEEERPAYSMYYKSVINTMKDIIYLKNINISKCIEYSKTILNKEVKYAISLFSENIKLGFYLYTLSIGGKIIEKVKENYEVYEENVRRLVYCCTMLSEYIVSYVYKFRNKQFKSLIRNGEIFEIEYKSINLLYDEEIEYLMQKIKKRESTESDIKFSKISYKITNEMNQLIYWYANDDNGIVGHNKYLGYLYASYDIKIPLVSLVKPIPLSHENFNEITTKRKYAIHSSGVNFNFLNKESVDIIEMYEDLDNIYFIVHMINDKIKFTDESISDRECLNFVASDYMYEKKVLSNNRVKLEFKCNKSILAKNDGWSKVTSIRVSNFNIDSEDKASYIFIMTIKTLLLVCIYIAFCNPYKFKKQVLMERREFKKSGSKRDLDYRIGYLRLLPEGYKMSDEARLNARKKGFLYIPDGYTFVREVKPENAKKKVIDIEEV